MKRILLVLVISLIATLVSQPLNVAAQASNPAAPEPYAGQALCLPDVYLQTPPDCLVLGPSAYLTEMAQKGITFPARSLPASRPPSELTKVEANFAALSLPQEEPAPVYGSLDAAINGGSPSRYIQPGFLRYVSFTQRSDVNGGHYVMLKSGEWMRASPASYSSFQGLVFHSSPRNDFGWIVEQAEIRSAPSYGAAVLMDTLPRESQIQIYDTVVAENTEWYLIGADQWVEHRFARRVEANRPVPEGVDNNRWIEINLFQQTISVYDQGKLVFSTLIASGLDPFWTQPGLFKIYQKKPLETMTGAFEVDKSDYYYLEDVPWTMYFDEARALHGAYWRAMYGYPQSHGCVNLSIGDSRWLYDWAVEGDWVYVWDPSGVTPTDPAIYGKGGA